MLKGWEDVFETDQKEVVEKECRKNGIDFSWNKNDGLSMVHSQTAVERHPDTGEKVWFNHVQVCVHMCLCVFLCACVCSHVLVCVPMCLFVFQ